jgi:hypothetical protein
MEEVDVSNKKRKKQAVHPLEDGKVAAEERPAKRTKVDQDTMVALENDKETVPKNATDEEAADKNSHKKRKQGGGLETEADERPGKRRKTAVTDSDAELKAPGQPKDDEVEAVGPVAEADTEDLELATRAPAAEALLPAAEPRREEARELAILTGTASPTSVSFGPSIASLEEAIANNNNKSRGSTRKIKSVVATSSSPETPRPRTGTGSIREVPARPRESMPGDVPSRRGDPEPRVPSPRQQHLAPVAGSAITVAAAAPLPPNVVEDEDDDQQQAPQEAAPRPHSRATRVLLYILAAFGLTVGNLLGAGMHAGTGAAMHVGRPAGAGPSAFEIKPTKTVDLRAQAALCTASRPCTAPGVATGGPGVKSVSAKYIVFPELSEMQVANVAGVVGSGLVLLYQCETGARVPTVLHWALRTAALARPQVPFLWGMLATFPVTLAIFHAGGIALMVHMYKTGELPWLWVPVMASRFAVVQRLGQGGIPGLAAATAELILLLHDTIKFYLRWSLIRTAVTVLLGMRASAWTAKILCLIVSWIGKLAWAALGLAARAVRPVAAAVGISGSKNNNAKNQQEQGKNSKKKAPDQVRFLRNDLRLLEIPGGEPASAGSRFSYADGIGDSQNRPTKKEGQGAKKSPVPADRSPAARGGRPAVPRRNKRGW